MPSGVGFESMVDSIFLDVIRVVPQLLLVVLVIIVAVLIGKDILNGIRRPFLKPDQWQALPLTEVKKTTHNTRLFRFALPHADQQLGLPAGQHITLKITGPHGDEILRCVPGFRQVVVGSSGCAAAQPQPLIGCANGDTRPFLSLLFQGYHSAPRRNTLQAIHAGF